MAVSIEEASAYNVPKATILAINCGTMAKSLCVEKLAITTGEKENVSSVIRKLVV